MTLFEVYAGLAPGEEILSDELKKETGAVEMSVEQAEQLGFGGLPDEVKAANPRLIAVHESEANYVRHKLENHPSVHQFRAHQVTTE